MSETSDHTVKMSLFSSSFYIIHEIEGPVAVSNYPCLGSFKGNKPIKMLQNVSRFPHMGLHTAEDAGCHQKYPINELTDSLICVQANSS